jgi:BASS family bile acid:Na+ symporter
MIYPGKRRKRINIMEAIDAIRINFNESQLILLNILLGFLMFGVALDLKVDNFKAIARFPKASVVGLSSQLILLPILTVLLIFILNPPTSIALGMLLIAACPGGNVSNFAVHLAKGNAALSILLTSISTLGAIIITPLYFSVLTPLIPGTGAFQKAIHIDALDIITTIVQLILVPLAAGMLLHAWKPKLTKVIRKPIRLLSMLVFLGFVVAAVLSNYDNIVHYLHIVFFLVFIHNALALTMGYWFAKANKLKNQDAKAISLETGIQNSGLGLILVFNVFNGIGGMALILAWWGVWHLISAFSLAMYWNGGKWA